MTSQIVVAAPTSPPAHHRVVVSAFPFERTLAVLKGAIAAVDLWLIAEINPQALLAKADFEMPPARQLLFFHPRYMARLLSANPNGLAEAPLKFVLLAYADGKVRVHHPDPARAFAAHPGLGELGQDLATVTEKILSSITQA
jgi:uncharacterized protein (DUF302 family)